MLGDGILDIIIIDSNSNEGIILRNRVLEAVGDINEKVTITLVSNNQDIKKYNIHKYPGLVINNKLTLEGRLITVKELNKILKNEVKKIKV